MQRAPVLFLYMSSEESLALLQVSDVDIGKNGEQVGYHLVEATWPLSLLSFFPPAFIMLAVRSPKPF